MVLENEAMVHFIQFYERQKSVNNPFTVIHYGQHFSHSFRFRKRDSVMKQAVLRAQRVYANQNHGVFQTFNFFVTVND